MHTSVIHLVHRNTSIHTVDWLVREGVVRCMECRCTGFLWRLFRNVFLAYIVSIVDKYVENCFPTQFYVLKHIVCGYFFVTLQSHSMYEYE